MDILPNPVGHDPGAPPPPRWAFGALLGLRVLTVVNDNLLRWMAIGLGKRAVAAGQHSSVLTIGTAGFVLPFVLLAWLSGWLADRYPKRAVIAWCKFAEILIAVAAAAVIVWGVRSGGAAEGNAWPLGLWALLGILIVIGCQAALLAPAVIGTIPETVPSERLSSANGLFAMLTLVATLAGTAGGNWLADITPIGGVDGAPTLPGALPAAAALVGVAVFGWVATLFLADRPAADPTAPPPFNALARTLADLRDLARSADLSAAAVGSAFFWALGAMANLNVDQFVAEGGSASQSQVVPFLFVLGAGIGAGSVLAGRLSTRGVNLGLVPAGAILMTLASLVLWLGPGPLFVDGAVHAGPWWCALGALLLLGLGAGLFDVPLEAHFQERSPPARRGALLAALNLLVFAAMFLASVAYGAARMPAGEAGRPLLSARGVFGGFALLGVIATAAAIWCAPRATLRSFVSSIIACCWRLTTRHADRFPAEGAAVVVSNHVSWLDGFTLVLAAPRALRMVVYGPNIRGRFLRMLADQWRFILFEPSPKSIGRALKTMQQGLAAGDAIGIFSEGGISRHGQLLGFKRGLEWVLDRGGAPIVPAHIDGMWGSLLSCSEGRFFTKWMRRSSRGRRALTVWFGTPLPVGTAPATARLALQDLSAWAVRARMAAGRDPDRDLAAWLRRHGRGAGPIITAAIAAVRRGDRLDASSGEPLPRDPAPAAVGPARGVVGDPTGRRELDWAALAATAEAFDGCCLVRRDDRLVSSLHPGDPLHLHLGVLGGPLLGIAATVVDGQLPADRLLTEVAATGATLWLARIEQIEAASRADGLRGARLAGVVMPLGDVGDLERATRAAVAFQARHGLEPVVAFAPAEVGGLVSMNTPPSRAAVGHEATHRAGTLGRVVNGVVVWPDAAERRRLGVEPAASAEEGAGGLVVAATAGRDPEATPVEDPASIPFRAGFQIDGDGFLLPPGADLEAARRGNLG